MALTHGEVQTGPAHWRKWLRIGTRGLIVLVLFIAVGLGWLVNGAHAARRGRRVAKIWCHGDLR